MTTTVYTVAGERCDCGEPQEFCYWCDRPTPACPACGQPQVDEDTPTCSGEDGKCSAHALYLQQVTVPGYNSPPRGCGCECNSGGFCGGCGHAGCGRRWPDAPVKGFRQH